MLVSWRFFLPFGLSSLSSEIVLRLAGGLFGCVIDGPPSRRLRGGSFLFRPPPLPPPPPPPTCSSELLSVALISDSEKWANTMDDCLESQVNVPKAVIHSQHLYSARFQLFVETASRTIAKTTLRSKGRLFSVCVNWLWLGYGVPLVDVLCIRWWHHRSY